MHTGTWFSRTQLGFQVNCEKIKLSPVLCIFFFWCRIGIFFGVELVAMTARLSGDHACSVLNCLRMFKYKNNSPSQRLLGNIAFLATVTPLGLMQIRQLQHWLHARIRNGHGAVANTAWPSHRNATASSALEGSFVSTGIVEMWHWVNAILPPGGPGQAPICIYTQAVRGRYSNKSWQCGWQIGGEHDLIIRFLRGVWRLNPQRPCLIPSWDLSVVLQALQRDPFEPLQSVELSEEYALWMLFEYGISNCAHFKMVGDL